MQRLIACATLVVIASCASGRPAFHTMPAETLLQYGLDRLERRNWDDAAAALQQFTFQFPTHPRYQEARLRLGDAYFGKREFLSAASEYNRLSTDFPASPLADDARFRVCESYHRLSPRPQLDQQYTVAALDHCESLVSYYPDSPFVPRAREIISEMTDKLAEKLFMAGEYYYRIRAYDSAIKYFDDALTRYPESDIVPRTLYRLYEAYDRLGYTEEAQNARDRLLRDFPTSEEARRLQGVSIAGAG